MLPNKLFAIPPNGPDVASYMAASDVPGELAAQYEALLQQLVSGPTPAIDDESLELLLLACHKTVAEFDRDIEQLLQLRCHTTLHAGDNT